MGFGKNENKEPEKNDNSNESTKEKNPKMKMNKKKEEKCWNSFWVLCIIFSAILIVASCFFINDFNQNIKKHNVKYPWPKLYDLFPALYILPMVIFFKLAIERLSKGLVESCLAKKYKQPKNQEMKELGDIYRYRNNNIWILCSKRSSIFSEINGWKRIYASNVFTRIS